MKTFFYHRDRKFDALGSLKRRKFRQNLEQKVELLDDN